MGASSVSGKGSGNSAKLTTTELAILANGPSILIAGSVQVNGSNGSPPTSPPTSGAIVKFPTPFEGSSDDYVVILTAQNSTDTYVSSMNEVNGNFSGFNVVTGYDCEVMYIVTRKGIRAKL